ncbi:hypothetical protein B0J17DRAFT_678668 [Rhizoctonia solani]|nr:hypothetical protein B0J17DRAFT_678668 [Rhizoctonia solani]
MFVNRLQVLLTWFMCKSDWTTTLSNRKIHGRTSHVHHGEEVFLEIESLLPRLYVFYFRSRQRGAQVPRQARTKRRERTRRAKELTSKVELQGPPEVE